MGIGQSGEKAHSAPRKEHLHLLTQLFTALYMKNYSFSMARELCKATRDASWRSQVVGFAVDEHRLTSHGKDRTRSNPTWLLCVQWLLALRTSPLGAPPPMT